MELRSEMFPDALLVTAMGKRLDANGAIEFKDRLRELTSDVTKRVVLDMAAVDFVDSSGLGAIVAAMKQTGKRGGLELAALSPAVDKVFRLTRMDTIFTIHADAELAVGSHRKAG